MLGLPYIPLFLLALLSSEVASGPKVQKKPPRSRPCLDLPEEILEQMFGRLSVGVLSAFHHTLQLAPQERENLTCPSAGRPGPDSKSRVPVNMLSISPWAYRISHDPARYPRFIPEAYCLCKGCLTGPNGEESEKYRSTPVFMPSVILRRTGTCAGGRHAYVESYVSIAVGCTCVPLLDKDAKATNQSQESSNQSSLNSKP
ncbi:interleukin-17D-like [Megalops cyprinoides]|uniref:interleukin-17D-like n=1 Tax=Megalops cyprinoides TaxID=118141 RepID=UPI001863E9BF|nr:interleukin-17D-like [Megalops cyprinoides]XP_036401775.1 interleukin-17D-like [Megalops cyprinoides]